MGEQHKNRFVKVTAILTGSNMKIGEERLLNLNNGLLLSVTPSITKTLQAGAMTGLGEKIRLL